MASDYAGILLRRCEKEAEKENVKKDQARFEIGVMRHDCLSGSHACMRPTAMMHEERLPPKHTDRGWNWAI